MSVPKACGPRSSAKRPAYIKDELVELVVQRGLVKNKTAARKETVAKLCHLAGLVEAPPSLAIPALEEKAPIVKECGPRASKAHPSVYTKPELLELALERKETLGLTAAEIKRMSKNALCNLLFQTALPTLKTDMPETFTGVCEDYTLTQLRYLAKKYKLPTSGSKERLCERLMDNLGLSALPMLPAEVKEAKREDPTCMIPPNKDLALREHQKRVVRHMLEHRGLIAIHGTGTGKTATAVTAMNCILDHYPEVKVIFISPLSLLANFKKEIVKFGLSMEDPKIKHRVRFFSKEEFASHYKNDKAMRVCDKTFLIVDEAHNLRSEIKLGSKKTTGAVAATVIRCASRAFKVLLLSATPFKNRSSDIINLITMVDGIPFTQAPNPRYFKDYILEDEDAFAKYFTCKISMNLTAKDENYPRRIEEVIPFVMTPTYYRDYFDIQTAQAKKFLVDLYGDPSKFKLFYSALRRASLSLDKENSPKVQWTFRKIQEDVAQGKKVIAYTAWQESGLNYVRKLLDQAKIPYGLVTGKQSAKNREFYKNEFNRGAIKVLLLSKAGGEGLDLEACSDVILMEPNWNAADDEQIIGRAIRFRSHAKLPKDKQVVNVYRLIMKKPPRLRADDKDEKSVDEMLADVSRQKQVEIDAMLARLEPYSIESVNCKRYAKGDPLGQSFRKTPEPIEEEEYLDEPEEEEPQEEGEEERVVYDKYGRAIIIPKKLPKDKEYVPPVGGTSLIDPKAFHPPTIPPRFKPRVATSSLPRPRPAPRIVIDEEEEKYLESIAEEEEEKYPLEEKVREEKIPEPLRSPRAIRFAEQPIQLPSLSREISNLPNILQLYNDRQINQVAKKLKINTYGKRGSALKDLIVWNAGRTPGLFDKILDGLEATE